MPVDVLNKKSKPLSYFLITSGCDELTRKIKNSKNSSKSFLNTIGNRNLLIVRAGSDKRIHKDSDEFSLDLLAEEKCEELFRKSQLAKSSSLQDQYKTFKDLENNVNKLIALADTDYQRARQVGRLADKVNKEKTLEGLKDQLATIQQRKQKFEMQLKKNNGYEAPSTKRKLRQQAKEIILKEADIIISTLNYCGNPIMDCLGAEKNKGKCLVDLVIVDEAAQSVEVESLIPLRFGCNKMIQVGDPEQLRATVKSKKAQVKQKASFHLEFRSF